MPEATTSPTETPPKSGRLAAAVNLSRLHYQIACRVIGVPSDSDPSDPFLVRFRNLNVRASCRHLRLTVQGLIIDAVLSSSTILVAVIAMLVSFTAESFLAFAAAFFVGAIANLAVFVFLVDNFDSRVSELMAAAAPFAVLTLIFNFSSQIGVRPIGEIAASGAESALESAVAGAIGGAAVALPMAATLAISMTLAPFLAYWDRRNEAEILVVSTLLRILIALDGPEYRLMNPKGRSRVGEDLEYSIRLIEFILNRTSRSPGVSRSEVAASRVKQIVTWMRWHQVAWAIPEMGTAADVRRMSLAVVRAVCTGRFGALPIRVVDAGVREKSLVKISLQFLRSLVVALTPLLAAILLDRFGVLGKDAAARTVVTVAAVWAVLGILAIVDPLVNSRVQATRDIMSIFKADPKK